jgi:hypothetical protein
MMPQECQGDGPNARCAHVNALASVSRQILPELEANWGSARRWKTPHALARCDGHHPSRCGHRAEGSLSKVVQRLATLSATLRLTARIATGHPQGMMGDDTLENSTTSSTGLAQGCMVDDMGLEGFRR